MRNLSLVFSVFYRGRPVRLPDGPVRVWLLQLISQLFMRGSHMIANSPLIHVPLDALPCVRKYWKYVVFAFYRLTIDSSIIDYSSLKNTLYLGFGNKNDDGRPRPFFKQKKKTKNVLFCKRKTRVNGIRVVMVTAR